jgi:aspartyl/asparaginyl-tRNA synthetase
LIGIGKNLIEKNKTRTSLEDFITEGSLYVLNKKKKELKLKDEIEVIHYLDIIESLNKKKIEKRVILKDATASVIQNLIKILGPKDQESLNLANLGDSNY